ncbi:MAG: GatB/YqeY domain-containing protein, partial [Patescibacteria group bacterium]|nr:GatB/YqeY domain-containing protein [Patescibacteria group bacterium]
MTLKEKIKSDLKDAMKSGDGVTRGVLRLLSSDIKNEEIAGKKELANDDVLKIIKKDIKRHKESIEQYRAGGRKDSEEQEKKELGILEKYLPEQMSEDEIRKIVSEVVKKLGAASDADFGKVMGMAIK